MPIPPEWTRQFQAARELNSNNVENGHFERFVLTEIATSWDMFLGWLNELGGPWGFRGQRQSEWLLHPSLDRAVTVEIEVENGSGHYHLDRGKEECELLFKFKQQAHRYIKNLPSRNDLSSWLALMQHHGVPTRLLDWTRSPHVAMYFALEEQTQGKAGRSAIWAIDLDWLEVKSRELLRTEAPASNPDDPRARADYVNNLLTREESVVVSIDPLHADERMAAQQGFFLCKLRPQASFDQILMTMIQSKPVELPVVRKLEVDRNLRIDFLKRLREMNIHRASLFPDLDGFGRFLALNSEIKSKEAGVRTLAELQRSGLKAP